MAKPRWIEQQPFAGKSVIIAGGSQGMGLAVAKEVAQLGGSVCIIAIGALEEAKKEVELLRVGKSQFVETILCDTTDMNKLVPLLEEQSSAGAYLITSLISWGTHMPSMLRICDSKTSNEI